MARIRIPSYRLHRPSGQAVVTLSGKDHYLGRHGTDESRREYDRLTSEWLRQGRAAPTVAPPTTSPEEPSPLAQVRESMPLLVSDIILAYMTRHVRGYYLKDGRPTSEQSNISQALRFLRRVHGGTPLAEFGPIALKEVREDMIERKRCRKLINKDVHRIRAMFRWAVAEELFSGEQQAKLLAITALEKGRSNAKELPPVREVPEAVVRATLPHLPAPVAAAVELQLLTAARPGEILAMRPRDVDRSNRESWIYRPESHKTQHHGHERVIFLGPRAQVVLLPWLGRRPEDYCFSPWEVVQAAGEGKAPRPKRGGRYSKDSYRVAIQRGCVRAGQPKWTPHQLRHTQATAIRARFDAEAAMVVLGHSSLDVTQIYANRSLERARDVMRQLG